LSFFRRVALTSEAAKLEEEEKKERDVLAVDCFIDKIF